MARLLRTLTGVDETLLDTIPTERPRYTAMGGVVLGTAVIAMFSMAVALLCVFDGFNPSILVFVPVWGAFILFLDRWLMASSAARETGARFRKLLPRLVLSILFGIIIAEPLLLGVFHTAVEKRIRDDRIASAGQFESDLKYCNPLPGKPRPAADGADRTPDCGDKGITVPTDVPAKQTAVDDLQKQIDALKASVAVKDKEHGRLESLARKECGGVRTSETTGRIGQGPNCRRLRSQADQYRVDQGIQADHDKLNDYDTQLKTLNGELAGGQAAEGTKINAEIARRVTDYKGNQREIGLLERLGALGALVDENGYMRAGEWALRLFFIAVDALPVLLKFLSGFTPYDDIVADRVARQRRLQQVASETERRRGVHQEQLARHQMSAEHAAAVGKIEFDARMRNVDVEVLREELTDARAEYLLHDSPTLPIAVPPQSGPRHGPFGPEPS